MLRGYIKLSIDHQKRRKEIYEELYPETGQGKTPGNQYTGKGREAPSTNSSKATNVILELKPLT